MSPISLISQSRSENANEVTTDNTKKRIMMENGKIIIALANMPLYFNIGGMSREWWNSAIM